MTLDQCIERLPPSDSRKAYWENIRTHIQNGNYGLVCDLVSCHRDDYDYNEQVMMTFQAIAKHAGQE